MDHILERSVRPALGTFLETGSNVGSTLGDVVRRYPDVDAISCEPDAEACAVARRHAVVRRGVRLLLGTSQELMHVLDREPDREERFARPLLAWLDAHGYGFEWPLREEIEYVTSRFRSGFALVDDFRVPGDEAFGWDQYQGHECSFDYVRDWIAPDVAYRLYYPAYREHTSPWHPLRGWGLLQFGEQLDELESLDAALPEVCRLDHERAGRGARSSSSTGMALLGAGRTPNASESASATGSASAGRAPGATGVPSTELGAGASVSPRADRVASGSGAACSSTSDAVRSLDASVRALQDQLARDGSDATAWNDLAVHLAHGGDLGAAIKALTSALAIEPDHVSAGANFKDLVRATRPDPAGAGRPAPVAPGAWGRMVARDAYTDLAHLIELDEPTIVDGGANRGDTVARWRQLFPSAWIHAFEPNAELAAGVRARFEGDERLVVRSAALAAEEGAATLNVFASDRASSLLPASELKRRYQGQQVDVVAQPIVTKRRLDRVVNSPIDVVKLDVQGFELEALAGLGDRIAEVRALLLEVEFAPLFDGQPLFGEVDAAVRAQGFRLFNLYDLWTHPDGQMTSGDALYLNERYFA